MRASEFTTHAWAQVRAAFPVLQKVVYLNTGTYGLMPEPALEVFLAALADFERMGVASTADLHAGGHATRRRVAALLGAEPDEIAFTRNATDGINLVLAGISWREGDEVITTTEEHEAMIHPLLYLQRRLGVRVRRLPVAAEADVMQERLDGALTERTRLVAMSHVTCESGTRLPARAICAWAEGHGLRTLFDGAQTLGVFPIDVREIGCDFYVSNGHKWLSGPKGSGIFYGKLGRLVELFPAHVGAGTLERVDLEAGTAEPWATAQRFEFGTRSWTLAIGLGASLDWFDTLGWPAVEGHIAALASYLKQHILERPTLGLLTPLTWDNSSGLASFTIAGHSAADVSRALQEQHHIYVRVIPHYNAIRIACAHFNNEADIDALMDAIDRVAKLRG